MYLIVLESSKDYGCSVDSLCIYNNINTGIVELKYNYTILFREYLSETKQNYCIY